MRHVERLVRKAGAFRWRGEEVTRVEALSDAVFGFAITLLVVSLDVPRSVDELLTLVKGFPAFAICFALLVFIWHTHHIFFRRYDLQDGYTITLNAVLLFIVVFYIYPLKFLFGMLVAQLLRIDGPGTVTGPIRAGQGPALMSVYSLGYLGIFFVFFLLYLHAYRLRGELELSEREIFDTLGSCGACLIHAGVGAISIAIALLAGDGGTSWAGWVYFLLGPAFAAYGTIRGRRRRRRFGAAGA